MRTILLLSLLFSCLPCHSVSAQERSMVRDSLPVFVINDREFASIVDRVMAMEQDSFHKVPAAPSIYITLCNNKMTVDIRMQEETDRSDSLILYENPYFRQALILHNGILFRTNIESFAPVYIDYMLMELLDRLPTKQCVYFLTPPTGYYDTTRGRTGASTDFKAESYYEYDGIEWVNGFIDYEDDRDLHIRFLF